MYKLEVPVNILNEVSILLKPNQQLILYILDYQLTNIKEDELFSLEKHNTFKDLHREISLIDFYFSQVKYIVPNKNKSYGKTYQTNTY